MMNKNILLSLFVILLASIKTTWGQDIHFSNYYYYTPSLNPAMIGNYDGKFRVGLTYRGQWLTVLGRAAFNTISFQGDAHFLQKKLKRGSALAAGAHIYSDFSGAAKFGVTAGGGTFTYHQGLDRRGKHRLSLGMQFQVLHKRISLESLVFLSQINIADFAVSSTMGETINRRGSVRPDFNVGLAWTSLFSDFVHVQAGAAVYHLGRPVFNFIGTGQQFRLPMRFMSHARIAFNLEKGLSIIPDAVLYVQGNFIEPTFGLVFSYNFDNDATYKRFSYNRQRATILNVGLRYRLNDAVIIMAQIQHKRFYIGAGYDINVSSLVSTSNSVGSFELSLNYVMPSEFRPRRYRTIVTPFF